MSCIEWPIKDCYVVENLQGIVFLLIFVGNMTIRKATQNDLDVVLSLIQCGREKMIASGNTGQWTEGYPPQTQLESDIEKGNCYLISTDDNRAIATFAFIKGVDPTYLKIEGEALAQRGALRNHSPSCVGPRHKGHHGNGGGLLLQRG